MHDLSKWLGSLGLGEHARNFVVQGITGELVLELTDADLKELGVSQLGQRKRLLKEIARLAGQAPPTVAHSEPPVKDEGRRQLTVMFCDLVGSTGLSRAMDPEDLKELVRVYRAAVAAVVAEFDGYIAQFLGDGVLIYFGFPAAHEDDAARAVRAALGVLQAMPTCQGMENRLQARIGIATGLVVVGEGPQGLSLGDITASGETPNLASRLQSHAAPDEILVAEATSKLLGASFQSVAAGPFTLKGFDEPVTARRIIGERALRSRFDAEHGSEIVSLIGRESETALLIDRWNLARSGESQAILLTGEAGIGKSRVSQVLVQRLGAEDHEIAIFQCSPYFTSTALYALVLFLKAATTISDDDGKGQRRDKLMAFCPELSPSSADRLLEILQPNDSALSRGPTPQQRKAQMMQAAIDLLVGLSRRKPLLLLVEDAHWIDPTTDELLGLAMSLMREARMMLMITGRPQYSPSWSDPVQLTRLSLNRLGRLQCAELIAAVSQGRSMPAQVVAEIINKTDGVPLFVEELTKTVVTSGLLVETLAGYRLAEPLPPSAIPSTLQDSLMARLDRLGGSKAVAQAAAVVGREFSYALLRAVLGSTDAELTASLDQLVRAELLMRQRTGDEATYSFKHALVRDTAYHSLLKTQRASLHRASARAILEQEPLTESSHPELLAYHLERAGEHEAAASYWSKAGDAASRRSANKEAATHYEAALRVLKTPRSAGERDLELELQMKCGNALTLAEGTHSAKSSECYGRAKELAIAMGRLDRYIEACGWSFFGARHFREVLRVLDELEPMADSFTPMVRVTRCTFMGTSAAHLALWEKSWTYLTEARAILKTVSLAEERLIVGAPPAMTILTYCARVRFIQGFLDQAVACLAEALAISESRSDTYSRAWALQSMANMDLARGDYQAALRRTQASMVIAEKADMKLRISVGQFTKGRALVGMGDVVEGRAQIRESLSSLESIGLSAQGSEFAALAADALLKAGCRDEANWCIEVGEKVQNTTEEKYYGAELCRLRARLLEDEGRTDESDRHFERAIQLATEQGALLFRLRAVRDFAASRKTPESSSRARDELKYVLGLFSEGADFPDLLEASRLL